MKRTANLATFPARENYLKLMLQSIENQFNEIRIFANGYDEVPEWMDKYTVAYGCDLTDNGKFYFLSTLKKPEFYFSLDDDIVYPPTYACDMITKIKEHGTIVTHHGRLLLNQNVSYYRGHKSFHCMNNNLVEGIIDVAGTGVTAFDTSYFNPKKIFESKDLKMSDLVFSLEASKQNKKITVLSHECGYLKALPIPIEQTIFGTEHQREERQIQIANEIFRIKNNCL